MFPTSLQHPYVPRGRRRGRNDPNSRDYICPCGKSYLSYPALFTHIKIKHNGRAPGQIIKPKSQNPSKRGRPRQKQVYDSQSDTNDIAANCIDRLCDFVTDFEKPDDQLCRKLKNLYIQDPFYRVYLNYNPQEQEPRYNERQDLYDEYCDNVFCEVIAEVNKRLNEPFHIDAVTVFFMLIAHFIDQSSATQNIEEERNEQEYRYGDYAEHDDQNHENQEYMEDENEQDQIVEEDQYIDEDNEQNEVKNEDNQKQPKTQQINQEGLQKVEQANKSSKYIENQYEEPADGNQDTFYKLKQQPIRNIVNYINDFIINYTPKYYDTYSLQDFDFFKQNNIQIFMELLFNWMSMKKYVGYKVKVNHNYTK